MFSGSKAKMVEQGSSSENGNLSSDEEISLSSEIRSLSSDNRNPNTEDRDNDESGTGQ